MAMLQQTQQQEQEQRTPLHGGEVAQDLLDLADRVQRLHAFSELDQERDSGAAREGSAAQDQDRTAHPTSTLATQLQALQHRLQPRQQGLSQDRGQEMEL